MASISSCYVNEYKNNNNIILFLSLIFKAFQKISVKCLHVKQKSLKEIKLQIGKILFG